MSVPLSHPQAHADLTTVTKITHHRRCSLSFTDEEKEVQGDEGVLQGHPVHRGPGLLIR